MPSSTASASLIFCTCPDSDVARSLAEGLVERQLAACVNVLPGLTSVYRWQGEVHSDPEYLLLIKTAEARVAALTEWLAEAHPYELPEIVAVPIKAGLPGYIQWVCQQSGAGA